MTILTLVLLGVEWAAIGAMSGAALAREHSDAASLVTQTIAEAEALPFSELQAGLDPSSGGDSSFTTDSNIVSVPTTTCSSGYQLALNSSCLEATNTSACQGVTDPPPCETPIVPHIVTETLQGVSFSVATYPTVASTAGVVNVVVEVKWHSPTGNEAHVTGAVGVVAPFVPAGGS